MLICENCGAELTLPPPHLALLDEDGFAHIRCANCQIEVLIDYPLDFEKDSQVSHWRKTGNLLRSGNWLIGIALLLIAAALAATLLPISISPPRPKKSPMFSPEEYVVQPLVNVSIAFAITKSFSGVDVPITSTSGTSGLPSRRTPLIVT